jgi:NHL repeat
VVTALAVVVAGVGGATTSDRPRARLLERPAGVVAGDPWVARFELRRDGRALARARASVWIRRGSGSATFRATPTGRGRYRARVVFPAPGTWRLGVSVAGTRLALGTAIVLPRPAEVEEPFALAVAPDGRLAVADRAAGRVVLVGDGTATVVADGLRSPISVGFDASGTLHLGDETTISRVGPGGLVRVAGNGSRGFSGDGGPAPEATLGAPMAFAFDPSGRLVFAEYDNRVRRVGLDGRIETIAGNGSTGFSGDGGPARAASLAAPHDLDVLGDGTVVVADSHNGRVRVIDAAGRITTLASGFQAPVGVAAAPDGTIVVADAGTRLVYRLTRTGARTVVAGTGGSRSSGDGGPATRAGLAGPTAVAVAQSGEIYVVEFEGRRVRRIDTRGVITTIAR